MPLIIPQTLPAYKALEEENVFVMHRARAMTQDIRPLRILLVNLMPTKIATETQIARMLANSPLQVQLTLLHIPTRARMCPERIWRRFTKPSTRSKPSASTA